jgi:hypothetical protein
LKRLRVIGPLNPGGGAESVDIDFGDPRAVPNSGSRTVDKVLARAPPVNRR